MRRHFNSRFCLGAGSGLSTRRSSCRLEVRLLLLSALACAGCHNLAQYRTPDRLERGCVIVLPGIEGESSLNRNIVEGLVDGGVDCAIEIYDWTLGGVFTVAINICMTDHNLDEAERIAGRIIAYQDQYPVRPLHLIGHSGGGGMAVLALEALPPDRTITSTVLLALLLYCTCERFQHPAGDYLVGQCRVAVMKLRK